MFSRNDPKSPVSQAILDFIKEKRRLRWLYNNTQDPDIKSTINRLQKGIRTRINQESTISWEKFCNSISLESDQKKSWRKITNFLKPKGHPTLKLGNKTAKTNPKRPNSLPKVSKETSALRVIRLANHNLIALISSQKLIHTISHH